MPIFQKVQRADLIPLIQVRPHNYLIAKGGRKMKEIKAETLAALYPLETRRTIRNYAAFIQEHPDWLETGNSLLDYKRRKVSPIYIESVKACTKNCGEAE